MLEPNNRDACRKDLKFSSFFYMICADCSHEEKFYFLLGDLFNKEGDIIQLDVDEFNFSRRKCEGCFFLFFLFCFFLLLLLLFFFDFKELFPAALIRRTYDEMCSVQERGSDS